MKKIGVIGIILAVLILGYIGYSIFGEGEITKLSGSENYKQILERIEKGNMWIIENDGSDECSSFRYYHRGCYYKQYSGLENTDSIIGGSLQYYNLTHQEINNLCPKMAHKGHVTFCLKSNNEGELCLDFAGDNEYLRAICELEEGVILRSEFTAPTGDYCESNICYPTMKYSDLI